jgi:SAM-dependent methyltransferase
VTEATVRRLHWGCGKRAAPGWINSDLRERPGVDMACDILEGLPLEDQSIEYCVSMHTLPEIHYRDQVRAIKELRRVLKPGGVLRLGLPDLDKAIDAYRHGAEAYFHAPDDNVKSIGGKLIAQIVWRGSIRTPFTSDFAEELLLRAGFREVHRCAFRQTASPYPEIVKLDNRRNESLFIEATK